MATATYAYRRPFFTPGDDLFNRCLVGSAITGFIVLAAILITPMRQQVVTSIEQLPPRFAKLIVEKPAPVPVDAAPGPKGPGQGPAEPGPIDKLPGPAGPIAPAPPVAANPGPPPLPGGRAEKAPLPGSGPGTGGGAAGRARAQAVVATRLASSTSSITKSLEGLSSSLHGASTSMPVVVGRGGRRTRGVRAGRGEHELGSVQTGLSGTGGGGGSAPGVYRSNASLLAVIQKYAAGIQYCYGNELKRQEGLSGKLVVAMTVASSGEVLDATVVVDTIHSDALKRCALSQIKSWKFPPIERGVTTFQAPFVFTPPR
jgi:protein TonB